MNLCDIIKYSIRNFYEIISLYRLFKDNLYKYFKCQSMDTTTTNIMETK